MLESLIPLMSSVKNTGAGGILVRLKDRSSVTVYHRNQGYRGRF